MNIAQEINNLILSKNKNGNVAASEKIAIDYIFNLDFNNPELRQGAKQYISHVLHDFVEANEEITRLESKICHALITKITLTDLGLDKDIKIIYRDRLPSDKNAGAFYQDSTESITFFNESVCNNKELLSTTFKGRSRLEYFAKEVFKIEHECEHAVQYKTIKMYAKTGEDLDVNSFLTSQQTLARLLIEHSTTKYGQQIDGYKLYYENHDEFFFEIEADNKGYKRALTILEQVSPEAYNTITDYQTNVAMPERYEETSYKLANYNNSVFWKHDSNPNQKLVLANHKASMIIEHIIPKLSNSDRLPLFNQFPSLQMLYNKDGSKKSLDDILGEKERKINTILSGENESKIHEEVTKIERLYTTAIESDPLLSLEYCLQHITRLTWQGERYFTDGGNEVKYDPAHIRKELKLATKKAVTIAGYIEPEHASKVSKMLAKYEKELFKNKNIKNNQTQRFFEDKKLAMFAVSAEFKMNQEAQSQIKTEKSLLEAKRLKTKMQKEEALETLRKVFPNFIPTPQIYNLGEEKFINNKSEKVMLTNALGEYIKQCMKNPSLKENPDFISSSQLREAIGIVYDFETSGSDINQYYLDVKNGLITPVENIFEIKAKESATEEITHNANQIENEIVQSPITQTSTDELDTEL